MGIMSVVILPLINIHVSLPSHTGLSKSTWTEVLTRAIKQLCVTLLLTDIFNVTSWFLISWLQLTTLSRQGLQIIDLFEMLVIFQVFVFAEHAASAGIIGFFTFNYLLPQFICKHLVFPTWACVTHFNNNNKMHLYYLNK